MYKMSNVINEQMPDQPRQNAGSKRQNAIPSIMNIKSLPVNQAQKVDTDVLEPLVFSQEFARWELMPKGFLHPNTKISVGIKANPLVPRGFPLVNIGIHSLVRRAVLKTSAGRVICETEDWNVLQGGLSTFISNSANKEREQYTTGRQMNYEVKYNPDSFHLADDYGLSNNNDYSTINSGTANPPIGLSGPGLSVQEHLLTSNESTFQIALHDLFPFLKAGNQLPLYMLPNERIQIELFWEPNEKGNRMGQNASGLVVNPASTAKLYADWELVQTKCKLIADYVFYDQETMDRYAAENSNMTFSYIDYRLSKQVLVGDATVNNVRNIGGQGRIVNKVLFAYEDPNYSEALEVQGMHHTLTSRYTARNMAPTAGGNARLPLTSNIFVNSEFVYPQSIKNNARQFHNLKETGGMVPFVSRESYSGEGRGGITDQDFEMSDTSRNIGGEFFWQGFRLTGINSRVDSRGIDLHTSGEMNSLAAETHTGYVQRCWLEVVKYLTIKDGHLEVFFA